MANALPPVPIEKEALCKWLEPESCFPSRVIGLVSSRSQLAEYVGIMAGRSGKYVSLLMYFPALYMLRMPVFEPKRQHTDILSLFGRR